MAKTSFLMCRPDFYDTHFLFNPWMDFREKVNKKKAISQWQKLKEAIEKEGGEIELINPDWQETAQVFVRDNAFVFDTNKVLILRSYGPRGKREPKILAKWFKKKKYQVYFLPKKFYLEGGNILWLNRNTILAGWKPGDQIKSYNWFVEFLKKERKENIKLILLKLIDKKYLHLDTILSPLAGKGFLVYKRGLNVGKNWKNSALWQGKDIIELNEKETFGANLITLKETIITSTLLEKTIKKIEKLGFEVKNLDLSEFHKAGGGVHCLTLNLEPEFSLKRKLSRDFQQIREIFQKIYKGTEGYFKSFLERKKLKTSDKKFTFGEIDFDNFIDLIEKINPAENDIFYDLGSGLGKPSLAVSLAFKIKKAIGFEILPSLLEQSKKISQKAKLLVPDLNEIEFKNENFFEVDFSDGTIIFINVFLDNKAMEKLEEKLLKLKKGAKIIIIVNELKNKNFKLLEKGITLMAWGPVIYRIYEKV